MNRDEIWRFIDRITGFASGFTTIGLLALADRTGLLTAMAGAGPCSVEDVSRRAGIDQRYAEEIMSGLATAGVLTYDPMEERFTLPDEHATVVADDTSPYSLAGYFDMLPAMLDQMPALVGAAREGGGVPFEAFDDRAVVGIDRANSPGIRILLTRRWLPTMPDVVERLDQGGRVADIGCGSGTAALAMAAAFPSSEILGIDVDDRSIARAKTKREESGLDNVSFQVGEASSLPSDPGFDLVTALDVVHDLADPLETLQAVRSALRSDGVLLMMEPNLAPDLVDNVGDNKAALFYGISAMFCMTQSLARGGPGLGTAWGPRRAEELCREAGFSGFARLPIDNPFSAFYRVEG